MTNKQLAEFNAMKNVVIKLSNVVESLLLDVGSLQDKIKASELINQTFLGDNAKKSEGATKGNTALKAWNDAMQDIFDTSLLISALEKIGRKKEADKLNKKMRLKYFK